MRMFEYNIMPARGNRKMTFPAVKAEIRQAVIGIVRGVEIIDVAAFAVNRCSGEFIPALAYMAGVTIGYGMNTQQGEPSRLI